jgi:tetratricopeptide (TPR) repeat protein/DNA-binding transcriptional ArsR family regulator
MDGVTGAADTLDVLTRRVDVLQRLADAPAHVRDLVDELDQSRSTINRAIGELEDADLVKRDDDGYAATTAGRLALDRLDAFRGELGDVVAADAVLDPLPFDAPVDTRAVAGSDALLATDPAPYRPLERFHDDLADATRYRALLPALDDPRQVRLLYEHVVTQDDSAELVVAPDLFTTLREEFPRRMAAMAEADGFTLHVGDVPPFAVGLVDVDGGQGGDAETAVHVVVFSERGGVHGTLRNGTPGAVRWADERFEAALSDADDRTAELLPDPDGGVPAVDVDGGAARGAIGRSLSVGLERAGFVELDVPYFREEPVADPTTAWRAGLTVPEVHTGYAIERTLAADAVGGDGEREAMADALTADLAAGEVCVVVGPPGSGKSTVCKRVGCEWYDADRGPVLYREGGSGQAFASVADLVVTVDAAAGHTLVVVEDAVRPEADAVFEAIDRLGEREDVSFLLDARDNEWRSPPGERGDVDGLSVRPMPSLDDGDAARLIERFEQTVGDAGDVPTERLRAAVRDEATGNGAAPSEVLLLLHRLATYAAPLGEGETSLQETIAAVHDDLADDDLVLDVAVLANACNAAGVGFEAGALYAVADPDEFGTVDEALDYLEGRVLFPRGDGTYRTVHEAWSTAFFDHLLDAAGEDSAAERFGRCVSALLSLADDADRCDRIAAHCGERPLAGVDDPTTWAATTAESVHALGRERPKLAPLFGDGSEDTVALPAACPDRVADERPLWLGKMFVGGDFYDRAERAYERVPQAGTEGAAKRLLGLGTVAKGRGEYDDAGARAEECLALLGGDRPLLRGRAELQLGLAHSARSDYETAERHLRAARNEFEALGNRRMTVRAVHSLGMVGYKRGEYDRAREHLERSLDAYEDLGDLRGQAHSVRYLGQTWLQQGEQDRAREHYERGLDLAREIGDRNMAGYLYNNFGLVAANRGAYDEAREYYEAGLEVFREIGDQVGEAVVAANLGERAERVGEYGEARELIERSLEVYQEVGYTEGEATGLNLLGLVAARRADLDRAREHFRAGLEDARSVESPVTEANSLNGLGHVARLRGEYGQAREHHEAALAVTRDVGHPRRRADSLNKLGMVARRTGEYEQAREHHEAALELARDVDNPREESKALNGLGAVASHRDGVDRARERVADALDVAESAGHRTETARVRLAASRLALADGDVPLARERAEQAREAFEAMGATQWRGRARRLLGRVAAAEGDADDARDHWTAALATFEDVGAPGDALGTLEHLADACPEAGDEEVSAAWVQQARATLADAPEAVAQRHREWVESA